MNKLFQILLHDFKKTRFSFLFLFLCLVLFVSCAPFSHGAGDTGHTDKIGNNGAQQGAKLDEINTSLHQLEIKVNSQQNSIQKLTEEVNSLKSISERNCKKEHSHGIIKEPVEMHNSSSAAVYSKPGTLYKKARNLLLEGNFKKSAVLFMKFIKKYPDHELADNAFYWLGECHYTMADYKGAVEIFKTLVKRYPKREKVPDALLKTAYAYLSLNDVNRANYYLKLVVSKYPFSEAGEKAELKLKTLQ